MSSRILVLLMWGLLTCSKVYSAPRYYGVRVKASYPHDRSAFTQGLLFRNDFFYESTGHNGQSTIRKVNVSNGAVVQSVALDSIYFAEGLAYANNTLVQLTWKNRVALVYDEQLVRKHTLTFPQGIKQGWGLTFDNTHLILSDGSANLYFLDASSFQFVRSIVVSHDGRAIKNLNELEYINGEIFANVWKEDEILRISPQTGQVLGVIDVSGLLTSSERAQADVLNGIAYDAKQKRLFVTGKRWPKIFEIELVEKPAR